MAMSDFPGCNGLYRVSVYNSLYHWRSFIAMASTHEPACQMIFARMIFLCVRWCSIPSLPASALEWWLDVHFSAGQCHKYESDCSSCDELVLDYISSTIGRVPGVCSSQMCHGDRIGGIGRDGMSSYPIVASHRVALCDPCDSYIIS